MRTRMLGVALAFVAWPGATCFGHIHMTVDTGGPGTQAVIRAGYLPAESAYSVDQSGFVNEKGDIAVFPAGDIAGGPAPYTGWFAGDGIVLTSDFYFATGRLDGGDFNIEIVSVTPVDGSAPAEFAWGVGTGGPIDVTADSAAPTRVGRSYHLGVGEHVHGQVMLVSVAGTYDVTLLAWDANGVYSDSDPVVIRVHAALGCPADLTGDGQVTSADLAQLLGAWGSADEAADLTEDGVVDSADLAQLLGAWGPCPG